jgi:hypothetical protein
MPPSVAKRSRMVTERVWCYEQHLRGLTMRAVAEASGEVMDRPLSLATVQRRIRDEVALRMAANAATAAEQRQKELDRLDEQEQLVRGVQERVHVKTNGGEILRDPETGEALIDDVLVLQAQDRLLRIGERRAKLLGIDAPERIVSDATVRYEIVGVDTTVLK